MIKILVVDDEMDVCDFVKSFFEERDYRVYIALNGFDALRIVKSEKPDIILLDIRMKQMDGIEALKKIKAIDEDAKVIMVTAVVEQDKIDTACKLGACRYITKPLILEELESAVLAESKEVKNA